VFALTQSVFNLRHRFAGRFHENPLGPISKLTICFGEVDHEVLVGMTEAHHRSGREHIEDHLLGGAGLESGGTREDFGANVGSDGDVGGAGERRSTIGGDGNGESALAFRVSDSGKDIRSSATRSESDDGVVSGQVKPFDIAASAGGAVFGTFDRLRDGFLPAGDQADHEIRGDAKRRGAFGRVENAETSTGAGANVDEAATGLHACNDAIDGVGDGLEFAGDSGSNPLILAAHKRNDFARRHVIEVFGRLITLFGATLVLGAAPG